MNYKHLHYFWWVAKAGGVMRASEQLHVTPHTISAQVNLLEEHLGTPLFAKSGRSMVLTDAGKLAFSYAQDIFVLGTELEDSVRNYPQQVNPVEFRIGVADSVPKTIAYYLIAPATQLKKPIKIVCREWKLDSLLTELAAHRLDLVIASTPIPPSVSVRAYNHRLGESGVSFFATSELHKTLAGSFPKHMDGAPMLMPGQDVALRVGLDQWLQANGIRPQIIGEFDDSALMKAFGQRGAGIFAGPTVIASEIESQYGVKIIGETSDVIEQFYAISVERRVTHPCVVAITGVARKGLLAKKSKNRRD